MTMGTPAAAEIAMRKVITLEPESASVTDVSRTLTEGCASSLIIVHAPRLVVMVAPLAEKSVRKNSSLTSNKVSPRTLTVTVWLVTPGLKVSWPEFATKSRVEALLACVVKLTVTVLVTGGLRVIVKVMSFEPESPSMTLRSFMDRTGRATVVNVLTVLLAGLASASAREIETRLLIIPDAFGISTIVRSAVELPGNVPSSQTMMPPEFVHEPCDDVKETTLAPAGATFVSITLVASVGP